MLTTAFALAAAAATPAPALRPGLEPLAFLVGHCWRGDFGGGVADTHCFESAYGGQHVRDRHEVTGDKQAYAGETLYSFDGKVASFTYWNSQGGVSRGTMRPAADRLVFGEETYTGPDGRQASILTHWRRVGDDAYEAVTRSPQMPSMDRVVRYTRVAAAVRVSRSRAPDGGHLLVHEAVIAAPAEALWDAIATAKGWQSWAVPIAWAPEPGVIETSYTPTAAPGDASTIRQQVLAAIPGRMMAFRTTKAPAGFPDFDAYRGVTSVFELEPVSPATTRVRLTGVGYPDSDAGRRLLGFFEQGNRVSLEQLRSRFVSGPIDWSAKLAGKR